MIHPTPPRNEEETPITYPDYASFYKLNVSLPSFVVIVDAAKSIALNGPLTDDDLAPVITDRFRSSYEHLHIYHRETTAPSTPKKARRSRLKQQSDALRAAWSDVANEILLMQRFPGKAARVYAGYEQLCSESRTPETSPEHFASFYTQTCMNNPGVCINRLAERGQPAYGWPAPKTQNVPART